MKGYLYQFKDVDIDEEYLFWSEEEINSELLKTEYFLYLSDDRIDQDEMDFEEWCKTNSNLKIERVFLEEIYV